MSLFTYSIYMQPTCSVWSPRCLGQSSSLVMKERAEMDCNYWADSRPSCTAFKCEHTCMRWRPKGDWKKQGWIKARSARQAAHAVSHQQKRVSLCCRRALCLPRQQALKELNSRVTNTHLTHANLQLLAIAALVGGFLTWNNEWLWFPYPRMSLFTTNRAALHAIWSIVPTCLDCSLEWTKYILRSFSGHCMRKVRQWLLSCPQSTITLFLATNSYTLGLRRIRLSATDSQQRSFSQIIHLFRSLSLYVRFQWSRRRKKHKGFRGQNTRQARAVFTNWEGSQWKGSFPELHI